MAHDEAVQGYTFTARVYTMRGHGEALHVILDKLAEAGIVAEGATVVGLSA